MRYTTSLNSHWFQNVQPSKLNNRKKGRFSTKADGGYFGLFWKWCCHALQLVSCQCTSIKPFKWGTQRFWASTGSKMTSRQSWTMSVLVVKWTVFLFFQLWQPAILEPVGVQRHNVPHFKGLIVLNLDWRSSRAWQHFYLPPRFLEKSHFTPKKGQWAVYSARDCKKG